MGDFWRALAPVLPSIVAGTFGLGGALIGAFLSYLLQAKRERAMYLRTRADARRDRLLAAYLAVLTMGDTLRIAVVERLNEIPEPPKASPAQRDQLAQQRRELYEQQLTRIRDAETGLAEAHRVIRLLDDHAGVSAAVGRLSTQLVAARMTLEQRGQPNPQEVLIEGDKRVSMLDWWQNMIQPLCTEVEPLLRERLAELDRAGDLPPRTAHKQLPPSPP